MTKAPSLPKTYVVYRFEKAGGPLVRTEVPWKDPQPGQVIIKVLACGVCGTDKLVQAGILGNPFPRVPGHEIVGDIVTLGPGIKNWKIGQRVGAPWNGGHCGSCGSCKGGQFAVCDSSMNYTTGGYNDGGFAEYCAVRVDGICAVPEDVDPADVAPLMCAGVTCFKSIVYLNLPAGSVIAVQGVGGLGHLAIQYARALGHYVVAISSSATKRDIALKLGAHLYLDQSQVDVAMELQKLGGAKAIVSTVPDAQKTIDMLPGLGYEGKLLTLGLPGMQQATFYPFMMPPKRLSIVGFLCGAVQECEDTIEFSKLHGIRSLVEKFPLEKAAEAYEHFASARFRSVIVP